MIYAILDTNIWVYLANGYDSESENHDSGLYRDNHVLLFNKLREKVQNSELKILINDVIIDEWTRNKDNAQKLVELLEKKKKEIKLARKKFKAYLSKESYPVLNKLHEEIIDNINLKILRNQNHVQDIETFLKKECIKIPVSIKVKNHVANLALKKTKAPFLRDKNNFADAIILYSAIEFLEHELIKHEEKAIFISNNYKDFSSEKNEEKFHPDILEKIGLLDLHYQRHLPKALDLGNDLQAEIEEHFMLYFSCLYCGHKNNKNSFGYLNEDIQCLVKGQVIDNPLQYKLFDLDSTDFENYTDIGYCFNCETEHISCPKCGTLIIDQSIWDSDFCDIASEHYGYHCFECNTSFEMVNHPFEKRHIIKEKDST